MPRREYLLGIAAACGLAVVLSFAGVMEERIPAAPGSEQKVDQAAVAPAEVSPLKRDPFYGTLFAAEVPREAALSLEGIIWDESAPLSVINGEVVGPGSIVDGHTVVSIRINSVTLSRGAETVQLTL